MQEPLLVLLRGGTIYPPETRLASKLPTHPRSQCLNLLLPSLSLSPPAPPHIHSHTPHHVTYNKHTHNPPPTPQHKYKHTAHRPTQAHHTNTTDPHNTPTHIPTHMMQSCLHTYFSVHNLVQNKGDRETMLNDTREIDPEGKTKDPFSSINRHQKWRAMEGRLKRGRYLRERAA